MKENILKVFKELKKKDYLFDSIVELSINGQRIIGNFRNPILLKNLSVAGLNLTLIPIDNIDGYNLTLKVERGVFHGDNYDPNWKSVDYTFWSGWDGIDDEDDEDNEGCPFDINKFGKFEWRSLGERESYDPNGIRNKLWKITDDGSREGKIKDGNYFDYDDVGKVIDGLIELDILMDKQQEEKIEIYNKLRLEL